MFTNRLFVLALILTATLLLAGAAPAQEQTGTGDGEETFIEQGIVDTITTGTEDEYVPATRENLSKLYWAIGKLDIDDPKMIDYYLMINECQMYLQYYHNDFEWGKIQQATHDYILQNMDKFPTRLEIITPIALDRYDIENEEFDIAPGDKIMGLRRLDFAMNEQGYKETCTHTGEIYEYPDNVVIILNRPLVLEKVPVKRELAKLYIEEAKSFYETLPAEYQMKQYERMAFLRLKVRITQYKNTARMVGGALRAVVFGRLEGYEVYADPDKLKPLYIKNIHNRRFRRLHDNPEETAEKPEPELSDYEKMMQLETLK